MRFYDWNASPRQLRTADGSLLFLLSARRARARPRPPAGALVCVNKRGWMLGTNALCSLSPVGGWTTRRRGARASALQMRDKFPVFFFSIPHYCKTASRFPFFPVVFSPFLASSSSRVAFDALLPPDSAWAWRGESGGMHFCHGFAPPLFFIFHPLPALPPPSPAPPLTAYVTLFFPILSSPSLRPSAPVPSAPLRPPSSPRRRGRRSPRSPFRFPSPLFTLWG